MEIVVGLIISGIVTYFVVQDAAAIRVDETLEFGSSSFSPGLWGTGVFLLMLLFLPLYLIVRSQHVARLTAAATAGTSTPASATLPASANMPSSQLPPVGNASYLAIIRASGAAVAYADGALWITGQGRVSYEHVKLLDAAEAMDWTSPQTREWFYSSAIRQHFDPPEPPAVPRAALRVTETGEQ